MLSTPYLHSNSCGGGFGKTIKRIIVMRVFVTGATGFIGSAIVKELMSAGHDVLGLARSDAAATSLMAAGAEVHRGDLEDLDSLRRGAAAADGVIHAGFIHDFARFRHVCEVDERAIAALGSALVGSDKPLIVTAGVSLLRHDRAATEQDTPPPVSPSYPRGSERAADAVAAMGVRVSVVRLAPSVHGDGDYGFVPMLIKMARDKGVSAYVGDGMNCWTAVHRFDAARLFRLALENALAGKRFHGVAEEAIAFRDIADVIGRRLNIPVVSKSPEEAAGHFTWFVHFAAMNCPASNQQTREQLGWEPNEVGLIADIDRDIYFKT
jgi:nucleoside-diphosphate-sugar epimerase